MESYMSPQRKTQGDKRVDVGESNKVPKFNVQNITKKWDYWSKLIILISVTYYLF
jgi:hypothetical protein